VTAENPPASSAAVLAISGSAPHRAQIVDGLPDHSVVAVGASDCDELARRLADPPAAVVIAGCAGPDEERELTLFAASRAPAAAIVVVGAGAPAPHSAPADGDDSSPAAGRPAGADRPKPALVPSPADRPEPAVVPSVAADPASVLAAGAHAYLLEPLPPGQLTLALAAAVRHAGSESRHEQRMIGYRERIETMVEQAPVPMFLKDRRGRYRLANAAAHDFVGVAKGAMIGRTDAELLSPEWAAMVSESDRSVLAGQGAFEGERSFDFGGEKRTYLAAEFPYIDENGGIAGVFGVATDITGRRLNEAARAASALEQRRLIEALQSSRAETVDRLTRALHQRDACSGEHVSRMAEVAAWLAELVGFDRDRAMLLRAAAPMHDVGKIAIRDDILQKDGPLTLEERAEMERHARIGFEILDGSGSAVLALGAKVALTHHENWDGSGYPRGLRGEEIPIEGRIAAVADVFDALLSDRPYRDAMDPARVRAIIDEGSGSWFDPTIATALLENWDAALAIRTLKSKPGASAAPVWPQPPRRRAPELSSRPSLS
jgi:PAS domain S-box-containing protein